MVLLRYIPRLSSADTEVTRGQTAPGRPALGAHEAALASAQAAAETLSRSQTLGSSAGPHGDPLCAADRDPLGSSAPGTGLRLRHELLAAAPGLAARRDLAAAPCGAPRQTPPGEPTRLVPGGRRQFLRARRVRGKKTGPNPTDRRKAGSKHHVISDAHGIPLHATLTGANAHDVTQLLPLVDGIPAVQGRQGRPRSRPAIVQGDRAYDSEPHRARLRQRGIQPLLAKRRTPHGSGLGATRWVIERTIAWLHQFRRLRVRYERSPEIHEAVLSLGCSLICWNHLRQRRGSFC